MCAQVALASNCSLQRLVLNNNAFTDLDTARIMAGLQGHGEPPPCARSAVRLAW